MQFQDGSILLSPKSSKSDSYTLEPLTHSPTSPDNYTVNYYSQSGGNNADLINPSNYILTSSQTVYVFASNGDRFPCTEEKSFTVTVSPTPNINTYPIDFSAINGTSYCGEFILPTLSPTTYNINYYSQSGGNSANLIWRQNSLLLDAFSVLIYIHTNCMFVY